jgi:hypothetical protein
MMVFMNETCDVLRRFLINELILLYQLFIEIQNCCYRRTPFVHSHTTIDIRNRMLDTRMKTLSKRMLGNVSMDKQLKLNSVTLVCERTGYRSRGAGFDSRRFQIF